MAKLLLVRGAKQLLTLRGPSGVRRGPALQDLAIIEDGSLLIRDGAIAQVGTTRRMENLKEVRGADEIDVNGAVVMPGFVDAGLCVGPEMVHHPGKKAKASDFYEQSLLLMRMCMQHGTLNVQVRAGVPAYDTRSDIGLLRQLARIGDHPIGMTRSWRIGKAAHPSASHSIDYATTMSLVSRRKLAHMVDFAAETEAVMGGEVSSAVSEHKLGINLVWTGGDAEQLRDLLERLQPRSVSCPGNLTEDELAVLAQCACPVMVYPVKSIAEDYRNRVVRRLADAGAPLTLSSGYDAEMPVFNMQFSIAMAVLRLRLNVEQAIVAATINGAHALGLGHEIGSLESGKRADVLVLNLPDYRELTRRLGINHVGMVIREGKIAFNRKGWKVSAA